MWYYQENKVRKGPVSDVAMEHLFKSGTISANTKVWNKRTRKWELFSESVFFQKITGKQPSKTFSNLKMKTRIFRGMLTVMFVFFLFTVYLSHERILKYSEVFSGRISGIHEQVLTSEYSMRAFLAGTIFALLIAAAAKTLYSWAFSVTMIMNNANRDFKMDPHHAGAAFFVPFFNFVYPCIWMVKLYSAALDSRNKKIGPFDLFLISMWWFFSLLAVVLFTVNIFSFSGNIGSETFRSLFSMIIYADIIAATACVFWIAIISRILHLISGLYKKPKQAV